MPEAVKSRALERILERGEEDKAFTKERQHTAQAFTLHVEWKDGRRTEGFAWAHYHDTIEELFGIGLNDGKGGFVHKDLLLWWSR